MLLDPQLENYCISQTTAPAILLEELEQKTRERRDHSHMISGYLQGRFLRMISRLKKPKRVLDIGTFTGYSALCLAEGLQTDGELITIEKDARFAQEIQSVLSASEYHFQIRLHIGSAVDFLKENSETAFDLVFIDADKQNYLNYYELVLPNMPKGGIILADNTLWKGKAAYPARDTKTRLIQTFNEVVRADTRVRVVLLPIRDGLSMIEKI